MSDLLMTIDSDDEENPVASTSRIQADVTAVRPAQAIKEAKNKKDKKDTKGKKRARENDGATEHDGLDAEFHFDALGDGRASYTAANRRIVQSSAWDLDNTIDLFRKKNALPRISVDDIIARRRAKEMNSAEQLLSAGKDSASDGSDNSDDEDRFEELSVDNEEEEGEASIDDASTDGSAEAPQGNDEDERIDANEAVPYRSAFAALEDLPQSMTDAEDKPDVATAESTYFAKAPSTATSTITTNEALKSKSLPPFSALPGCKLSRPILLGLQSLGLTTPTPVQAQTIPIALTGKDIVGSSITGSGKTVAFWVGVLERLLYRDKKDPRTRVVVICPTRELAVQVHNVGSALARCTDIRFCLCVGGMSVKAQEADLKSRPDIVVSTPGRLIDHVRNTPSFSLDALEILIIDEADRILEEGFKDELAEIINACPFSRQSMLFSATITEDIESLARLSLRKPVRIAIDAAQSTSVNLTQQFVKVRSESLREGILVALCRTQFKEGQTIVFFRSKVGAHRAKILFALCGLTADELHGDLTQDQRLTALKRFREGQVQFLLATDLASRGLDIRGIETVVNYEPPKSFDIYLHRVGRTARAGKVGRAITLVSEADRKLIRQAVKSSGADNVSALTVDAEAVKAAVEEVTSLKEAIKEVMAEEKEEKQLRRTEMELQKGQNMLDHQDEIYARPARTWFQSSNEKATAKALGRQEYNDKMDGDSGKATARRTMGTGKLLLNHRQRRREDALAEIRNSKSGPNDAKASKGSGVKSSIRNAKKAAQPVAIKQMGGDDPYSSRPKPKNKKSKQGSFREDKGKLNSSSKTSKKAKSGKDSKKRSGMKR